MGFPNEREHIFVVCFMVAAGAAEVLLKVHRRVKPGVYKEALWEGYWYLEREAVSCAKEAKERGQLLFLGGVPS